MSEIQRRGNVNKCPVCGSAVDPDAFYCPTCHNYFCYHCRVRLLEQDTQLKCVNPSCDYYGKLTCGICDKQTENEESPVVYAEPEDGYWPAWLAFVLVTCAFLWYFLSFLWAAVIGVIVYVVGGFLMHRYGLNIFGSEKRVEYQKRSTYYSCVCCGARVEQVHGAA